MAARGGAAASGTVAGAGQWPPLPLDVLNMPTIEFNKWRKRADSIATYGSDETRLRKERRRYKNMHYARNTRRASRK